MNSVLLLFALSTLTHGSCTGWTCPSAITGCATNEGCYVQLAQPPRCSQSSRASCGGFTQQATCEGTTGCEWYPGGGTSCESNTACDGLIEDTCTNTAGCSWWGAPGTGGSCQERCYFYGKSECEDLSNGCVWKPNYCGGPTSCDAIKVAADCVRSETGCEWNGWNCQAASNLNCVSNSANTGCDSSSEVGCSWRSGYCTDNSKCQTLTSSQAVCEDDSKMCKWYNYSYGGCSYCEAQTGFCTSVDAYCQTKVDGSGCTPKSNQTMCSLKPAITAESCVLDEDVNEYCSLEGNSCSADALSHGCVNSDSNSNAFIVRTSSLLILITILSLLLF